jgi:hypothetical protein
MRLLLHTRSEFGSGRIYDGSQIAASFDVGESVSVMRVWTTGAYSVKPRAVIAGDGTRG